MAEQLKDVIEWAGGFGKGKNKSTMITYNGARRSLQAWALTLDISPNGLRFRLNKYPIHVAMKGKEGRGPYRVGRRPVKKIEPDPLYMFLPPARSLL